MSRRPSVEPTSSRRSSGSRLSAAYGLSNRSSPGARASTDRSLHPILLDSSKPPAFELLPKRRDKPGAAQLRMPSAETFKLPQMNPRLVPPDMEHPRSCPPDCVDPRHHFKPVSASRPIILDGCDDRRSSSSLSIIKPKPIRPKPRALTHDSCMGRATPTGDSATTAQHEQLASAAASWIDECTISSHHSPSTVEAQLAVAKKAKQAAQQQQELEHTLQRSRELEQRMARLEARLSDRTSVLSR